MSIVPTPASSAAGTVTTTTAGNTIAQRILQKASIASFLASPALSIALCLWLVTSPISARYQLKYPVGRMLFLLYAIYIYCTPERNIHNTGGRPSTYIRSLTLWKYFRDYFPAKLIRANKPLLPHKPKIIAIHPHGIWSSASFCNIISDNNAFPGLDYRVATIPMNFKIPIWRELVLGIGLVSVDRESISYLLKKNISVGVVIGGALEALDSRPGTNDLTLGTRLGFVRMALEYGANLIPVFNFGENDIYPQLVPNPPGSLVRYVQELFMDTFSFSVPLIGSIFPRRRPLTTVIGDEIELPHIPKPTLQDILHWHEVYVRSLQALYDKWVEVLYPQRRSDLKITDPLAPKQISKLAAKFGDESASPSPASASSTPARLPSNL